jgi:long-chain acyl-CoA synthetase
MSCCFGFCNKYVPRGKEGFDLKKQSKILEDTVEWVKEKDDNGQLLTVCQGPWHIANPAILSGENKQVGPKGLVMSASPSIQSGYDLIFGVTEFDDLDCLGHCVEHHTYKDAILADGTKNPKPSVVDKPGTWKFRTYKEVKEEARCFGAGLREKYGIQERQKVSIWSENCPEWMIAELSCSAYNWASVSVYATLGPNAASYIVADSGAQVLVAESKVFKGIPAMLQDEAYANNPGKDLKVVVIIGDPDIPTCDTLRSKGIQVVKFAELVEAGKSAKVEMTPPKKDDLATIMYTSGTTGMPKGVKLSHKNSVATVSVSILNQATHEYMKKGSVHLSYLPLAHIFERVLCYSLMHMGGNIWFSSMGTKALLPDLSVVRPTIFAGVPKVYENVRDAVMRKMTGFKGKLFAKALAAKTADIETGCGYNPLYEVIFNKTKMALGGRVEGLVSGGAPISKETHHFVRCALGPIGQGYGATETYAASCISLPFDLSLGHVGPPFGSVAVRLVDVPDMNYFVGDKDKYVDEKIQAAFTAGKVKVGGEVWIGGHAVSPGYFDPSVDSFKKGLPSNGMLKKTQEDFFFDKEGYQWFKTGDIGMWNAEGCLKIVDRKKNMFKTSIGEYVPVEEVEKTYQDLCPYADFVFIPKETKVAYVAVCVVVEASIGGVMKWAKENKVDGDDKTVVASDAFRKMLFEEFKRCAETKKLQRFLWIQKPENIHIEFQPIGYQEEWVKGVQCSNGHVEQLLTATFKSRRQQLDAYFAPAFPKIYPGRPADHILP